MLNRIHTLCTKAPVICNTDISTTISFLSHDQQKNQCFVSFITLSTLPHTLQCNFITFNALKCLDFWIWPLHQYAFHTSGCTNVKKWLEPMELFSIMSNIISCCRGYDKQSHGILLPFYDSLFSYPIRCLDLQICALCCSHMPYYFMFRTGTLLEFCFVVCPREKVFC